MKKQLLTICLFAFIGLNTKAQITIGLADFLTNGGLTTTGRDTSSFIFPGPSGANQVWDFSNNIPSKLDSASGDIKTFTPNPLFPGATHGTCTTIPSGKVCVYLDISATGAYTLGTDNTFTLGLPSHQVAILTPKSLIYPFPMNYNQINNQSYVQNQLNVYSSPSPNDSTRIAYHRTIALIVDGWGTIKTPYNTHNVLRIKKINSNIDTTYNHPVGGVWTRGAVTPLRYDTSFVWLANGLFEVASMSNYSTKVRRFSFLKSRTLTGVNANPEFNSTIKLYPNPTTNSLHVESVEKIQSIICSNYLGQNIELAFENQTIDVSKLSPGFYFLTLFDENGKTETLKFLKQ